MAAGTLATTQVPLTLVAPTTPEMLTVWPTARPCAALVVIVGLTVALTPLTAMAAVLVIAPRAPAKSSVPPLTKMPEDEVSGALTTNVPAAGRVPDPEMIGAPDSVHVKLPTMELVGLVKVTVLLTWNVGAPVTLKPSVGLKIIP